MFLLRQRQDPAVAGRGAQVTGLLLIPVIALARLRECFTLTTAPAMPVGFASVVRVLRVELSDIRDTTPAGPICGALAAEALVRVRRLAETAPPTRMVFCFAILATAIWAIPLACSWRPPSPTAFVRFEDIAAAATPGQVCRPKGFAPAPARISSRTLRVLCRSLRCVLRLTRREPVTRWTVVGARLATASGVVLTSPRRQAQGLAPTAADPG